MKKLILTLFVLLGMACTPDTVNNNELSGVVTADLKGLVDGTRGVDCDAFVLPPSDQFYTYHNNAGTVSLLEFRLNELNNYVYFRFYPKNGKFQEVLTASNLTGNILYAVRDADGNLLEPYKSGEDIFRIRIVGINGTNYDETICFKPTSYVSAIYLKGKQALPEGDFEVEFIDYTQFGVGKKVFSNPYKF